ncbi:MAG: DNA topoisomerase, partial [Pseudomonadota bacterium]
YEARLTMLAGKKLDRYDIENETQAEMAVQAITSRDLTIQSVEAKPATRNPSPPFMTSTLQQEASRKFGMGARQTMSTAQRLYEAGYITYMRTDGIDMAPEAVTMAREAITNRYGAEYVPEKPRVYKNKAKNAQEAHECIRPTDMARDAGAIKTTDDDQRKLYDLIWKRTLACQMAAARLERTTIEIGSTDGQVGLRATGQVIMFEGFLKVYEEGRDDVAEDDDDKRLPQIMQGESAAFARDSLRAEFDKAGAKTDAVIDTGDTGQMVKNGSAVLSADEAVLATQSFTQPPPRYTEATLVKRMEELGIGRPSTYASIVTTIQDRGYVRKDRNRLFPEDKGRLVTAFLENYFRRYVGYGFTADLEEQLDDVSAGSRNYKDVLSSFWRDFSAAISETSDLRITEVLEKINEVLEPHLFPPKEDGGDPRLCPNCEVGRLSMRTARSGGAFIGCSNYPECRYTRPFGPPSEDGEATGIPPDGKLLGEDQGDEIRIFKGRFGPYVQRGAVTEEQPKPPRQSVPKGWVPEELTLEQGLRLLSLPRQIGPHPEDGVMIWANIGRYGPYLKHAENISDRGGTNANLDSIEDVFEIGMNRAVEVIAAKPKRGKPAPATPLKELGEHPDGGPVNVMKGRYGPYVKWGKINATLPESIEPDGVTMEQALELIAEKAGKSGKKKTTKRKKSA